MVRLSRSGASLERDPGDMALLDALGVAAGVKPVSYINLTEADRPRLTACEETARFLGLRCRFEPRESPREIGQVYFSKDAALTEEAVALRGRRDPDSPGLHALLGYPPCCSGAFMSRGGGDVVSQARRRTAGDGPYPFLLNNLFNTAGRAAPDVALKLHVLPWHPCRYDCGPSLAAGGTLFRFIEGVSPDLAGLMRSTLTGAFHHQGLRLDFAAD